MAKKSDLERTKQRYRAQILDGMSRTLWVMAYADFASANARCEFCGETIVSDDEGRTWVDSTGGDACPDNDEGEVHVRDDEFWPVAGSGEDWDDIAPTTPPAAIASAQALVDLIEQEESASITDLFELAMTIDQGEPFEWHEDSSEPSEVKRQQLAAKLEAAYEFGSGLAHEALGSGVAWGDDRKTKRDGAEFAPRIPHGRFDLTGFGDVQWEWVPRHREYLPGESADRLDRRRHGTAPIDRRIRIAFERITHESTSHGDAEERGWEDEEGVLIDGEESGYHDFIHHAVDVLRDQGGERMEPSSSSFHPGVWYTQYGDDYTSAPIPHDEATTNRSFHLAGFPDDEERWVHALYTGKIGRIHIANTPASSGSYSYPRRSRTPGHDYQQNFLFWFATTYVLVFGNEMESALDEAVDFIEEQGWEGLFADKEVEEEYERLVKEACDTRGLPDETMLSERTRDKIREEAEVDTTTAGNHSRYLRSYEWGIVGEDLSLEQLVEIGEPHRNPSSSAPVPNAPPPRKTGHQRFRQLALSEYPRKIRQRREARMPTCSCPVHDVGQQDGPGTGCGCPQSCPGWAVFETNRRKGARGLGVQACDECNMIAKEYGLPIIHEEDVRELDDARALIGRGLTGDSRTLADQREREGLPRTRRRRNPSPPSPVRARVLPFSSTSAAPRSRP